MLVLSRRQGQRIRIGTDIVIEVTEGKARLGIRAPGLPVLREEVWHKVARANAQAAGLTLGEPLAANASEDPQQVPTTRFGTLVIRPEAVIQFPHGLIGFSGAKRFVALKPEPGTHSRHLQSLDFPALALQLADLPVFYREYEGADATFLDRLERELVEIGGTEGEGYTVGAIVTNGDTPDSATVNLLTPIVIGQQSKLGRQCVFHGGSLSPRCPLARLLAQQSR